VAGKKFNLLKKLPTSASLIRPGGSKLPQKILLSVLVGLVSGLAATLFEAGLHYGSELLVGRFTHLGGAQVLEFRWGILLLPVIGGIFSAVFVSLLAPDSFFGHGTNILTKAFHHKRGYLPLRGSLVKGVAAVGVISCGGSAGPEGPIAALGSSIGSTIGRLFDLPSRDVRIYLVCGCAAGVGAIFRCPLGGALFAASILYREPEFEPNSLMPALISSIIGYSTFMAFWGYGVSMLTGTSELVFSSPLELLPFTVLGILSGFVSIFFYYSLKTVESIPFARIGIPRYLAPVLGGLAVGLLACALPQVMDSRYLFIQNALDGSLFAGAVEHAQGWWYWAFFFLLVALTKVVATSLTIGSGAAGGFLGPSVFIGGCVGAAVGAFFEAIMPGSFPEPLREALIPVGMAGVLSASMRVPLATVVMVTEMTGSYGLIVPLMLVSVISYLIGRDYGLNHEQIRNSTESPAHAGDSVVNMLETIKVGELVNRDWPYLLAPATPLAEIIDKIEPGTRPTFVVLAGKQLKGIVAVSELEEAIALPDISNFIIAADIMGYQPVVAYPEENIYEVLDKFKDSPFTILPVVHSPQNDRFIGMIDREDIQHLVTDHRNWRQNMMIDEHAGLSIIEQDVRLSLLTEQLPEKQPVVRIPVPPEVIGQSLIESDFRSKYNYVVLAIQPRKGGLISPPDPHRELQEGDLLVVLLH
jgi:chloride channel protein, CIC family